MRWHEGGAMRWHEGGAFGAKRPRIFTNQQELKCDDGHHYKCHKSEAGQPMFEGGRRPSCLGKDVDGGQTQMTGWAQAESGR